MSANSVIADLHLDVLISTGVELPLLLSAYSTRHCVSFGLSLCLSSVQLLCFAAAGCLYL